MLYMVAGVYFLLECLMAELGRGFKAGILAGLVYGIFQALSGWFLFPFFASLLGVNTSPSFLGGHYVHLEVSPFESIILGLIWGVILGPIYALAYNRLPGREIGKSTRAQWTASETKGIVLTLIAWLIVVPISIAAQLPTSLFVSEIEGERTLQIIMTAWGFVLSVPLLGRMLGWFWNRFKPKIPPPPGIPPPP
jgi:hypothetical protein